jgi:hypothetical protein
MLSTPLGTIHSNDDWSDSKSTAMNHMNSDQKAELEAGAKILEPALAPHGFVFAIQDVGKGSRGNYAWGMYTAGDRSLHLHHRWGLGIVEYHIGGLWIAHSAYLNFLGVKRQSEFASLLPESGLERYHALHSDLTRFCGDFIYGPAIDWASAATAEGRRRQARSEQQQAGGVGDNQKRKRARELFRDERYAEAISLLEPLHYPELLSHSEEEMLRIARDRMRIM